jgi:TonB-dependent SusC/RagA subfamily outer membrane receptor
LIGPAVVVALVHAVPAAAQRSGTVEVGAFGRYTAFDHSLALGNAAGVGGRLAVYVHPTFAVELDISRTSADGGGSGGSVTHSPLHAWLVYSPPLSPRAVLLMGGGYVRNRYAAGSRATDRGLAGFVGVRYRLTDRLALRIDANEDFVTAPANASPQVTYNANLGIRLGLSVFLNPSGGAGEWRAAVPRPAGGGPQDSVQVGYGSQSRQNSTGAITTIIPTEADTRVARVEDLLRNRVPGLEVIPQVDGSYALRIRGQGGMLGTGAETEPLLVVDGSPVPAGAVGSTLAGIAPRDVARIEVMRDAAATSIYGSRGAGGVILISTKRAR